MIYPYMTSSDETEIVHSQMIEEDGGQKVIAHFERPTKKGSDSIRCELPDYKWVPGKGYPDEEVAIFKQFLRSDTYLLYRYAISGGI